MDDSAESTYESTLATLDALARFPERDAGAEAPRGLDPLLATALQDFARQTERLRDHGRDLAAALVRYMQAVLPLIDTGDRLASAMVTLRSERALEAVDRRLEARR